MGLLSQGQRDADLYGYGPAPDPSAAELDRALIGHLTKGGLLGVLQNQGMGLLNHMSKSATANNEAIRRGGEATGKKLKGEKLTPEEEAAYAENPATGIGTADIPGVGAGTFAGVGAKTADHVKLGEAKEMLKKGASEAEIRGRTGWFKGADGHWRFEIPDNNLKLTADGFEHPELFEAYPEIKDNTPIEYFSGEDDPSLLGYFKPDTGAVGLRNDMPEEARSSLIHELQHKVQETEGHSPGTSTMSPEVLDIALRDMQTAHGEARRIKDEYDASLKDFLDQSGGAGWFGPKKAQIDQFHERYPDLAAANGQATAFLKALRSPVGAIRLWQEFSFDAYQRTLGETEARAVQDRLDYTPDQRRMTPPLDTQDIPHHPMLPNAEREILPPYEQPVPAPAEDMPEQPKKGILDWFR